MDKKYSASVKVAQKFGNIPPSYPLGLILLLCLSLCPETVNAYPQGKSIITSQFITQTQTQQQTQQQPPLDPNRAAAEKAEAEASQLFEEQKAPLSQQIAKYEEALKYRRLAGDRPNEANNLLMLSMLYQMRGEYSKGLDYAQQSLSIIEALGDRGDLFVKVEVISTIASIYNSLGEKEKAINYYQQAISLAYDPKPLSPADNPKIIEISRERMWMPSFLNGIAESYKELALSRFIGARDNETTALQNIGYVYQKLEDYPQALQYYQQALSVSRTTGNCLNAVSSLQSISEAYLDLGNYQKAITAGNEALDLSRNLGDIQYKLVWESRINRILAKVEIKRGNYAKALELAEKAQKQVRDSGFRLLERAMVATIAEAYEAAKQPEKAIATYQEELTLNRRIGLQFIALIKLRCQPLTAIHPTESSFRG